MGDLKNGASVSGKSTIFKLVPLVSCNIIRSEGRLQDAGLPWHVANPVIIPSSSRLVTVVALHYHKQCHHHGSSITRGATVRGGYHIVGGSALVKSLLHHCVTCRKLRAKLQEQRMNFLPPERTTESAPFERVGVDLFGPFEVKIGASTRSRSSTIKMWGCIFTCLTSRAAHIEPLDSADTSSFINAFRRFCAIRGLPSLIISDRGGNFVRASKVLSSGIDMEAVEVRLRDCGITWEFNPPHASHFGGVWERVIGSARRVMDGMLKELHGKTLDRDSLITMFAEASRVINTTLLWTTSWETGEPASLSPADLLMINQCEGHHAYSATERDLS